MNVTDFNFELPPELIAQDPLEDRAASRLLVLDKKTGTPPFPRYFALPEKRRLPCYQ